MQNGTIRYIAHEFPFAFYSNYDAIFYPLRDIASYWSKIAKFLYPPVFSAHAGGDPVGISGIVDTSKTRTIGLPYGEEIITIYLTVFIEYRNVTDGRTDIFAISISRVSMLTCDKNL